MSEHTSKGPSDFIRDLVEKDLASGKYGSRVVTRFPPEPNGYLHIGHAKSICLNFGIAEQYGGRCNLRFDDTNPTTEDPEYVEAIKDDIRWLGFDWDGKALHASDYFERLYDFALELIEGGHAYVDSLSEAEIREYRGTVTEPGRPSPDRDRSIEESLDLFRRMRAGEFSDGSHVLRARIDMGAANMKMRDPLLYRIRHATHYRSANAWCIYPMYDFAHCLSDAIEGITHSLCTLEFENNRDIYDWVLAHTTIDRPAPEQTEFARLNLTYTVVSKRKLLELVEGGLVESWDDPRMPTLSGLRRRGYTPAAIRSFCDTIGVSKANSTVDVSQLEHAIRDDLNQTAPRLLAVLSPLRVVITNYPEDQDEMLEAPYFPADIGKEGSRQLPFSRQILIERDDFEEDPPAGYRRLSPGREIRLRYAYLIRCHEVIRNDAGEVTEVHCTYDPETRGGSAPDGRKVAGTIHWVDAQRSLPIEARLYDRLFSEPNPGGAKDGPDFKESLNPDSLQVLANARIEPAAADFEAGSRLQFERQGFFYRDPTCADLEPLVFNRTVSLRDSWGRRAGALPAAVERPRESSPHREGTPRELSVDQRQTADRYVATYDLAPADAELLARDPEAGLFFEQAVAAHPNATGIASWLLNELRGELKDDQNGRLQPADLAGLVRLIDSGRISGKSAKRVLAEMLATGGSPAEIVERLDLGQIDDELQLAAVVAAALAAHPDQLAAYRAGKTALKGFFVGQVMKATDGRANPKRVQRLLEHHLASERTPETS